MLCIDFPIKNDDSAIFCNSIALLLSLTSSTGATAWEPACVASLGVLHGESGPVKEMWLKTTSNKSSSNWKWITITQSYQEYSTIFKNCQDQPSGASTLQHSVSICVLCLRYLLRGCKLCTWKLAIFPFKIWRLKPWPQESICCREKKLSRDGR